VGVYPRCGSFPILLEYQHTSSSGILVTLESNATAILFVNVLDVVRLRCKMLDYREVLPKGIIVNFDMSFHTIVWVINNGVCKRS